MNQIELSDWLGDPIIYAYMRQNLLQQSLSFRLRLDFVVRHWAVVIFTVLF